MSAAVQEEEKGSWEGTAQRAREKREGVRREAPKRIDRRRLAQPGAGAGERGEKRGRGASTNMGVWNGMGWERRLPSFVLSFVLPISARKTLSRHPPSPPRTTKKGGTDRVREKERESPRRRRAGGGLHAKRVISFPSLLEDLLATSPYFFRYAHRVDSEQLAL